METPLDSEGRAQYPTGEPALFFNEQGGGFAYYRSGRPAAFVSCLSDYQHKTLLYADDRSKTLLGSFDENAIGFALDTASKGRAAGRKLVLTAKGGLISDGEGYITSEWAWPKVTRSVTLQLNKCLSLVFKDRHNISVKFANEGDLRYFQVNQGMLRYNKLP